jgi:putative transposase
MSSRSRVCEFTRGVSGVFVDVLMFLSLSLRSSSALAAENLFLRKQLGLYVERKTKLRRATDAVGFTLAQLMRLFEWRSAPTVVKPDTF